MRSSAVQSDRDLLSAVRHGSRDAYGALWSRHAEAIRTAATFFTSFDADDITAETFLRILRSIERGYGPVDTFRTYALVTARNIAAEWGRGARDVPLDVIADIEDPTLAEFAAAIADDRSLAMRAFHSLPDRWQEVLWYSEVEQMKPAEIAPLLGMSANSVAALAVRAREGLKQGWIAAHLRSDNVPDEHKWVIERAAKYARDKLPAAARRTVDEHLEACPNCRLAYAEIDHASSRLALILLPIVLGTAAPGYAAWIAEQHPPTGEPNHHAPVRTVRASIITGGVVVVLVGAGIAWAGIGTTHRDTTPPATTTAHSTDGAPSSPRPEAAAPPLPTTPTASPPAPLVLPGAPPAERNDLRGPAPQDRAQTSTATGPSSPASNVEQANTAPPPLATAPTTPSVSPTAPVPPTPPVPPAPPTLSVTQPMAYLVPTLSGTGLPGATVTVTWTRDGTPVTTSDALVDANGRWKQSAPSLPAGGVFAISATQTAGHGQPAQTSLPTTRALTIADDLEVTYTPTGNSYRIDVQGVPDTSIEVHRTDGTTNIVELGPTGFQSFTSPAAPDALNPAITMLRITQDGFHGIDQDLSFLLAG